MGVAGQLTDPLLQGFYTGPEAARLLRIRNPQRIYRWLGRENPVIARDFEPVDGSQELSFWDLFEVRFVEVASWYGIKTAEAEEAIEFEVRLAA
ncbi:MAG TPA: hypothetical protein VGR45_15420 [Stellaceae bacterium]|nr:hypothetical protein [Stellaceae bacterium]